MILSIIENTKKFLKKIIYGSDTMALNEFLNFCNNKIYFDNCKGELKSENLTSQVENVGLSLTENNDVEIRGRCNNIFLSTDETKTFNGIFINENNNSIEVENIHIYHFEEFNAQYVNFSAKAIRAIISNGIIDENEELKVYIVLTTIKFMGDRIIDIDNKRETSLNIFKIPGINEFSIIHYLFKGVDNSTGFIEISTSFDKWRKEWMDIIANLYHILSFTASNYISMPVIYFISGKNFKRIELHTTSNETGRGSSIFYLEYPGVFYNVINSIYQNYSRYKDNLDMSKLFHYYIMMKNTSYIENAYLLGCIFMEGIKYTFAKKYKGYSENSGGYFLKPSGGRYSFRELVVELYGEFGLNGADEQFITYRNEIIHKGKFDLPFLDMHERKQSLELTIEKLLLNILGFKGKYYWDKENEEWTEY